MRLSKRLAPLSAAVKAGRDLAALLVRLQNTQRLKLSYSSALLKEKGIFAKLGATDESAIEKHFRQEEVRRLRKDMRELFMLYGSPGQWERLQATIAEERAEKQKQLRLAEHKRQQMVQIIMAILVISTAVTMLVGWVCFCKTDRSKMDLTMERFFSLENL